MAIRSRTYRLVVLGVLLGAGACSAPAPRSLAFGVEECAQCHMTLSEPRFAGQLVTETGKVIPFDDVGCLATFVATGGIARDRIHSLWVNDFLRPDSLLDVTAAVFLQQDSIHTPMDHGVLALRSGAQSDSVVARLGGRLLSWNDVLDLPRIRPGR